MNIQRILIIAAVVLVSWIIALHLLNDWETLVGTIVVLLALTFIYSRWGLRILKALYKVINAIIPWHRLPTLAGVLNLDVRGFELHQKNLHDTPKRQNMQPRGARA